MSWNGGMPLLKLVQQSSRPGAATAYETEVRLRKPWTFRNSGVIQLLNAEERAQLEAAKLRCTRWTHRPAIADDPLQMYSHP